ncbi:MAG TPA: hypothetical protein VIH35_09955 [Kiritimatiellia bacterium]|jgi:hypothetical protein
MERIRLILTCLLVALLTGSQWIALQGAAWTGMLVARSVRADIATAVRSTFDGQHPCRMCSAIKQARASESAEKKDRTTQPRDEFQVQGLLTPGLAAARPGHDRKSYPILALLQPSNLRERPPVPPPR